MNDESIIPYKEENSTFSTFSTNFSDYQKLYQSGRQPE